MVDFERYLDAPLSRRQVLRGAGVLAGSAALAQFGIGCGGSSSKSSTSGSGPETTTVKVGIIKFADTIPFWVADQQGFFKKRGLTNVQGVEMVGGAAIQPAIQSGQLDLGWTSVPSVITAKAHNFDFKFSGAGGSSVGPGHYANESMLVKQNSPIHGPQDLVGKKVGLNTLGNIAELEVRWWLDSAGVDASKVKLVELNAVGPDEVPPLIQGRVDAIQVNEPTVTAALKKGGVRRVGDWSFLAPKHVFLAGWASTGKWLDDHPKTANAFAAAMKEAAGWISANKAAANKLTSEKTGVPEALINAQVPSEITIPVTQADLTPLIQACQKYGLSDKTFPASEIVWQGSSA